MDYNRCSPGFSRSGLFAWLRIPPPHCFPSKNLPLLFYQVQAERSSPMAPITHASRCLYVSDIEP